MGALDLTSRLAGAIDQLDRIKVRNRGTDMEATSAGVIEVLVKELLPGQVLRQYKVTYLSWVNIKEHTSLAALAMSEKAAGADIVDCGRYETPEKAEKRIIEARMERRDGSIGGER